METRIPARKAMAAVKAGAPAEPVDPKRRITERVRKAIELLATGKCKQITEAAERVGMARESLGRALNKPHVVEFMRRITVTLHFIRLQSWSLPIELR